jgi:hypothetical protein
MAWLADGSASPSSRFPTQSTGPYRRLDGFTIARSWADLTAGALNLPINMTETGAADVNATPWTNTLPSGAARPGAAHCRNWTDGDGPGSGRVGWTLGFTSDDWTDSHSLPCGQDFGRLYCFQQS